MLPTGFVKVHGLAFGGEFPLFWKEFDLGDRSRLPIKLQHEPIKFWTTVFEKYPMFRTIARGAVLVLSTPISSMAAERGFSILTNREIKNRLRGGDDYVVRAMKLSINRRHVESLYAEKIHDIRASHLALQATLRDAAAQAELALAGMKRAREDADATRDEDEDASSWSLEGDADASLDHSPTDVA
jgi:hypothetical protein